MVVGSTMTDLLKVAAPDPKTVTGSRGAEVSINREPLCRQTVSGNFSVITNFLIFFYSCALPETRWSCRS